MDRFDPDDTERHEALGHKIEFRYALTSEYVRLWEIQLDKNLAAMAKQDYEVK